MEDDRVFYEKEEFFKNRDLTYSRDNLTSVFNREIVFEYMGDLLAKQRPFSLIICDIDNFKYVNDNHGHIIGDEVLKKMAKNLEQHVKDIGIAGRFGGDEFLLVVPDITEYNEIWQVCRDLNVGSNMLHIDELKGTTISLTLGIARYPIDGETIKDMMEKSDKALYRGKQKGRNCFIIYLEEKHANIKRNTTSAVIFNSMDMHAQIADILTYSEDLKENIGSVMQFLLSNLMLDHICIQSMTQIKASAIHELSYIKEFDVIPYDVLSGNTNMYGLGYINNLKTVYDAGCNELCKIMEAQKITGVAFIKIMAYGKVYGVLRVDSTTPDGRIWQNGDLDLLMEFARILGIILYYQNRDLDDVYK